MGGALPGIIMLAEPQEGVRYRQEYLAGEAEDLGRVIQLGAVATVPFGYFDDVIVTEDSSLIDPKLLEHKYYARGVGVVLEKNVRARGRSSSSSTSRPGPPEQGPRPRRRTIPTNVR